MRPRPTLPTLVILCIGLLAGCGPVPNDSNASPDVDTEEDGLTTPSAVPNPEDDFQPLQVNMVAEAGTQFPHDVNGVEFGCGDRLVTIDTVPIETESTEDHVAAAIEFLLNDSQYYHGSPSVTNSLTLSETLELDSVEVSRSDVEVAISGEVVSRGECEAYRIQAQMYGTAAITAEVDGVSITVDDTELHEVLGLEPVDVSELQPSVDED